MDNNRFIFTGRWRCAFIVLYPFGFMKGEGLHVVTIKRLILSNVFASVRYLRILPVFVSYVPYLLTPWSRFLLEKQPGFDVEYIYGFVRWGVCRQSRWRHSEPQTRWRICVTMTTLWQQQDGGYMLLWKRYGNNKMAAMRNMSLILHLQQYSHRLNLFFFS